MKPTSTELQATVKARFAAVAVSPGQEVKEGDKLVVLEAMKMLTTVSAQADGTVKSVLVSKGDQVDSGDLLVRLA